MYNCTHKKILMLLIGFMLTGSSTYAFDLEQAALILEQEQQRNEQYNPPQWQNQQQNVQPQSFQKAEAQVAPEAGDLFAAAINGNVNQVRRLLSQGLDINIANQERETSLHMAAARGHYSLVIYLVNNGAYVNAKTIKNWIPLHHAVRFRHPNIVNFLMKHGSSPHSKTSDGLSAADMARSTNNYRLLGILGVR